VAISFTTNLEFYDEYGNKYDIGISGTADNCLFTVYPFVESESQQNIIYEQKENYIKLACPKPTYYEKATSISANTALSC
jgi:hypothetical protein